MFFLFLLKFDVSDLLFRNILLLFENNNLDLTKITVFIVLKQGELLHISFQVDDLATSESQVSPSFVFLCHHFQHPRTKQKSSIGENKVENGRSACHVRFGRSTSVRSVQDYQMCFEQRVDDILENKSVL